MRGTLQMSLVTFEQLLLFSSTACLFLSLPSLVAPSLTLILPPEFLVSFSQTSPQLLLRLSFLRYLHTHFCPFEDLALAVWLSWPSFMQCLIKSTVVNEYTPQGQRPLRAFDSLVSKHSAGLHGTVRLRWKAAGTWLWENQIIVKLFYLIKLFDFLKWILNLQLIIA